MHPLSSCFSRLAPLGRVAALAAFGCLLVACDRHSADEVPESYGHGSSHARIYTDHQTDSSGPRSFSDSQGMAPGKEDKPAGAEPAAASPAGTAAPSHFFPNGS